MAVIGCIRYTGCSVGLNPICLRIGVRTIKNLDTVVIPIGNVHFTTRIIDRNHSQAKEMSIVTALFTGRTGEVYAVRAIHITAQHPFIFPIRNKAVGSTAYNAKGD